MPDEVRMYAWRMAPLIFDNDEVGFQDWLAKSRGYVINASRTTTDLEGVRLHRADCFTLRPGSGGGELQTQAYYKVCSWDPRELDRWAWTTYGQGLRDLRCQHCEPSDLGFN